MKKKIAFICTGNSCRSQMAEGFAKHLFSKEWEAYSAGVSPNRIQSLTIQVMKEIGIDISNQYSKGLDAIPLKELDYCITLCDSAKTQCPVLPVSTKKEHWDIPDPYEWSTDEKELLNKYREVRDEIKKRILEFKRR